MRVLGIDPGLRHTGWGIIDIRDDGVLKHVSNGTLKTDSKAGLADRLAEIIKGLTQAIELWAPQFAAVEDTFVNSNPASALKLGQARGVALSVPAMMGIPVAEYAPNAIKKTVVGQGHAKKEQVQMMLGILMPGIQLHSADAADAVAIAVCHAHHLQSPSLYNRIGE